MPEPVVPQSEIASQPTNPLSQLLAPAREAALALVPEAAHRIPAGREPVPYPGRTRVVPSHFRSLDGAGTEARLATLDSVLAPVHDIAVAAFQRMVDRLAGFTCPTLAENASLAEQVMLRVERFGLGLYMPRPDGLVRVRLSALKVPPKVEKTAPPHTVAAGKFVVRESKEPGGGMSDPSRMLGQQLASFPHLVVARTRAEAEQTWAARRAAAAPRFDDPPSDRDART